MTTSVMSRLSSRWPPDKSSGATNQPWPFFFDHQNSGRMLLRRRRRVLVPMKTNGQMRKRFCVADVVYDENSSGTTVVVSSLSWSRCQPNSGTCTRVSSCLSQLWK